MLYFMWDVSCSFVQFYIDDVGRLLELDPTLTAKDLMATACCHDIACSSSSSVAGNGTVETAPMDTDTCFNNSGTCIEGV